MLTSNLTLDPSATTAPAGETSAATAAGPAADGGERFADELAQAQSALTTGQNLAAGALPLQTLALGPALEVITASSDQPDGASLAAFAKAQGLDDDVVAWLFSDATQAQVQAQAVMAIPVPPGVMALPTTPAAAANALTDAAGNTALTALQVPTLPGGLATALPGIDPAAAAAAATAAGLASGPAPLSSTASGAPATPAGTAQATATAVAAASVPLGPGLLPAAPSDASAAAAVATTAAVATRAGWMQASALPTLAQDAAGGAQDTSLAPAQAATAQVQALTLGNAIRSARAAALNDSPSLPGAAGDMPVEILSLEMEPGLEALWDDTGSGQSNPAFAGADPQGAGASAGNPGQDLPGDADPAAPAGQRTAGYQELSQRLGEAVGKRILSQIERGNWEVRLMLKPARLGEVEIELTMRSGALDAAFRAANPVTRDLLNDGLPRLREVLAGAGIDIAGLNVGNGRHQQSGGNPTPRQTDGTVAAGPSDTTAAPVTASAPVTRARNSGSGWDVLV